MKRPLITRSVPLIDLERSGPDRRTVTAYAATFAQPYETRDQFGHYDEEINRAAFNRAAGRGFPGVQPLFNHGMTVHLTPSEKWSTPLGVPEAIRADGRGLLTVTKYNNTQQADEVLEMIESGTVKYHSFRGPVIRSASPRRGPNGRPLIERMELGLIDYGPAPFPVNYGAEVVALRSQMVAEHFGDLDADERREFVARLDPDERQEFYALLQSALPMDPPAATDPQPQPAADAAPERSGPSLQALELAQAQRHRR